jgi:hypothetical protein
LVAHEWHIEYRQRNGTKCLVLCTANSAVFEALHPEYYRDVLLCSMEYIHGEYMPEAKRMVRRLNPGEV